MPQSVDGDIRLSVSFNLEAKDVKREAQNLKEILAKTLNSGAGKGNPQLEKMMTQMQKSYFTIEKLQDKMKALESDKVPTAQYKDLETELDSLRKKTDELAEAREKWSHVTGTGKYFAAGEIEKIDAEFDKIIAKIDELERKKAELESSGGAFTIANPEALNQVMQQLNFATRQAENFQQKFKEATSGESGAESMKRSMQEFSTTAKKAFNGAKSAAKSFGRVAQLAINGVKKAVSGIRSAINSVKDGFSKLKDSAKNAFKHVDKSATKGLKNLLRYGLGIRGLFMLFRKLRGYATDAFKGIAQQSSSFNKTMSNITNTFNQFKGSIGTALQPLITIVEPILIRIMNLFINAANAVGSFFATLTGQKYIYKAVKANDSYADSISGTGKAAKEANKQLAEYDKLMVIQQDNAGGSGGGAGGGGGFTEELIDPSNSVSQFAQDLKDAWESQDFKAIGKIVADKLNEITKAIDNAINWDNVGPKIEQFMENWGTAFNSLIDNVDWPLIGKTVGDGLNTITYTVQSFLDNFNLDDLGGKFALAFNSLVNTIDWPAMGKVVSSGLNEITSAVNQFASNTNWEELGKNIASFFDQLLTDFDADAFGSALAAPLQSATETIHGFLQQFDENGTWAKYGSKIATAINSWFSSINWKMIGSNITQGVDGIVTALGTLFDETNWKDIGADLGEVLNGIVNIDWSSVGETISSGASGLFDAFNSLLDTVDWQQLGKDVVDLFLGVDWKTLFGQAGETLSNIITSAIDILIGFIKEFNFYEVIKTLVGSIVSFFANINWSDFASKISEFVGALVGNIVSSLVNFAIDVGEFAVNLVNSIKDWFKNKKAEWDEAGISVWEGIFQGIWNGIKNIGTWIKEKIWDPFVQGFKDAFGIHSPSTTMIELAGYLVDGLKEGLSGIWEKVKEKFTEMLGKIKEWFVEKKADLVKAWDAFKEGIGEVVTTLKAKVEDSFNKAKEAWTALNEKGKELLATLKAKTEEAFTKAKDTWNNLSEKAKDLVANLKAKTEEAFTKAKATWEGLDDKAKDLVANLKAKTEEAFTTAKKTWDGLKEETKKLTAELSAKLDTAKETIEGWWGKIKGWFTGSAAYKKDSGGLSVKAKLADTVKDWFLGLWEKFKAWFNKGKKKGDGLEVGAKNTTDKKEVGTWWDKVKSWWGTKKLTMSGEVTKITMSDKAKKELQGQFSVHVNNPGTIGGRYAAATGGIVRGPTNMLVGEDGPEAIIPLKNHTEWLDTVSKYVLAHLNLGKIDIPHLAKGQVIPPNRQFLAMLGDQKSGTNVEAPLKTIEQALENVLKRSGGSSAPIILQLDGKQIAKVVWSESDKRYKQTGRAY